MGESNIDDTDDPTTHTIESGETLNGIADDYEGDDGEDLTADDIAEANPVIIIDNDYIYAGDVITIPGYPKGGKENEGTIPPEESKPEAVEPEVVDPIGGFESDSQSLKEVGDEGDGNDDGISNTSYSDKDIYTDKGRKYTFEVEREFLIGHNLFFDTKLVQSVASSYGTGNVNLTTTNGGKPMVSFEIGGENSGAVFTPRSMTTEVYVNRNNAYSFIAISILDGISYGVRKSHNTGVTSSTYTVHTPNYSNIIVGGTVVTGVGIMAFDIITVPSGEGLVGLAMFNSGLNALGVSF
ncbi:MAG: LysM domain-containing protein [Spirochaetales bacterium]|nr:LysM domain-containing protein [Spirochaetales bacterium]